MRRYEKYKESNIKWIGLIPESWKCTAIKHILSTPITDGPHTTPELFEEGVPFVSAEAIKNGKIDFNKKRGNISEQDYELFSKKYVPQKGDIYMVKSGATTGNVAMLEADTKFTIWSPLAVFRADAENVLPGYLHYYLQSNNFRYSVELSWSYGTQQNIGMGVLSNLSISYPFLQEQYAVVRYLNHQTAIIDQLIEKKEKLVELLKEKRQAVINEAVTKGLDPNAKMKDSGIEWLGEVPEEWRVLRLKQIANAFGRIGYRGYTTEDIVSEGEGAITISPSNMKGDYMTFENSTYINWNKYHESPEIQIFNEDVLMVKTGSTYGKVGLVKNLKEKATINPQLLVFKNIKVNPEYFYNLLRTPLIQNQVETSVIGSTIPTLSQSKILNFYILIPSNEEIERILTFINSAILKIDNFNNLLAKQIDKLKEYRQSIISEAVTGKIDLRDWVPEKELTI